MTRIFLSHSSKNNAQAVAVADWLGANGWGSDDIFLDFSAASGIAPGERWQKALNAAAGRCEAVIFLLSRDWLTSRWCLEELSLAHKLNKRLFGVMIDTIEKKDVPARLRDEWQLIDLETPRDGKRFDVELPNGQLGFATLSASGLERLRAGLVKAGLDPRYFPWPPPSDPNRAPYRGMAPMEEEDAGIFYGREAHLIGAMDQLRGLIEAAPPCLMAVLGASGAGKSSFTRAGLMPRLKRDDRNFLVLPIVRPERAAVSGKTGLVASLQQAGEALGLAWTRARVAKAIAGPIKHAAGASSITEACEDVAATSVRDDVPALLHELATAATVRITGTEQAMPPAIILPIDQAEELFLAEGRDEAQALLALLAALLKLKQPRLVAVATIRTDSYEKLQQAPHLVDVRQAPFNLPALARGSYERVIEGPAERLSWTGRQLKIDPALTSALLIDLEQGGAKDALPLLAFTLERLYIDHGGDGDLTFEEYEKSGRIGGAIEAAVQRVFAAADNDREVPKDQTERLALLRRAMIPWLAGIDPEMKTPRRQAARFTDIPDEARPLIQHFVDQRLLIADVSPETGEHTIEPAHEALLRQWSVLDKWLKDDVVILAALEEVRRAARDWEANRREPSWLSHTGGRLELARSVKLRVDLVRRLDNVDLAYLDACHAVQSARRDRELEEARKLAQAERLAAEEQRKNAVALRALAEAEQQRAEIERQRAVEQQKVADTQKALAEEEGRRADAERRRARLARRMLLAVGLAAFLAVFGAIYGRLQAHLAEDARVKAVANAEEAQSERDRAKTQLLAIQARRVLAEANSLDKIELGAALALESIEVGRRRDLPAEADAIEAARYAFARLPISRLRDGDSNMSSMVALLDGRLVSGGYDGSIKVWPKDGGGTPATVQQNGDGIQSLAVLPDGRLASASQYVIKLWPKDAGGEPTLLTGGGSSLAILRDGRLVSHSDNLIKLWPADGSDRPSLLWQGDSNISSIAVLQDGGLVSGGYDGSIKLWPLDGTEPTILQNHGGAIRSLMALPDGRLASVGRDDGLVKFWSQDFSGVPKVVRTGSIRGVALLSDGRLATAGNELRLWPQDEMGQPVIVYPGDAVEALAELPDGRLASGGRDGIKVWPEEGRGEPVTLQQHGEKVEALTVLPDGRLASGGRDGIKVWPKDGKGEPVRLQPGDNVRSLVALPDGRLVSGGSAGINVWPQDGKGEPRRLFTFFNEVHSLAILPDGRLASGDDNGTVTLWPRNERGEFPPFSFHFLPQGEDTMVDALAVLPDGRLASAGGSMIKLWPKEAEGEPIVLEHNYLLRSLAVLADGQLASGGGTEIKLWPKDEGGDPKVVASANTGDSLAALHGGGLASGGSSGLIKLFHQDGSGEPVTLNNGSSVNSLAVLQDGRLASGDSDGNIKIWIVEEDKLIAALCLSAGRNLSKSEWDYYIGSDSPRQPSCRNRSSNWRTPDLQSDR